MIRVTPQKALLPLAAATAVLFVGLSAQAEESGQPLVVAIHADWCGTCTRLNATFDATDRAAVERSRAKAEELGISAFFDEYKSQTGTVGVLDASGRPIEVLKGETDPAKYLTALQEA